MSSKRIYVLILAAMTAAVLVGGLIYAALLIAQVGESASTPIHGPTVRRLWATSIAVLALVGAVVGGLAAARPAGCFGTRAARLGAVVAGGVAAINGALVLAAADGGPGTGHGVVGGAAALVLGLIATAIGTLALVRSRSPR